MYKSTVICAYIYIHANIFSYKNICIINLYIQYVCATKANRKLKC